MRAGILDRFVELQRRSTALDLYGTPIDVWTSYATMRAQKLENATTMHEGQRGDTPDALITFRMRWIDGVSTDDRVSYEGQAFKITVIKELGRRVGLDVTCERVG